MMEEKKFIIRPQHYSGETTVISMRLPKGMVADIDGVAEKTGRTRNEILIMSLEYALDNLQIEDNLVKGD